MRSRMAGVAKALMAVLFAVALAFGASQVIAANAAQPCDTPEGTCADDGDCDDACDEYNNTQLGGMCQLPEGCCICLE